MPSSAQGAASHRNILCWITGVTSAARVLSFKKGTSCNATYCTDWALQNARVGYVGTSVVYQKNNIKILNHTRNTLHYSLIFRINGKQNFGMCTDPLTLGLGQLVA